MNQLTFGLLDIIQLGDIIPHYSTKDKKHIADLHEVHDFEDKLLVTHYSMFKDKYIELTLKLQTDEYNLQSSKGKTFMKYREILNGPEEPTIDITAENIHEVKLVLLFGEKFYEGEDERD